MLSNYLTIAFRNLLRHKAFSLLNIMGLAMGMCCSILILQWIRDELSYDHFHTKSDHLYRITMDGGDIQAAVSVAGMAAALQAQLPAVKSTVRLSKAYTHLLEVSRHKFEEQRIFYTDANFFSLFTFPLIKGNVKTALSRPDGIIITEAMARKYFGSGEALGKIIRKDNQDNFTVTGILANIPTNSHLQFDFLLPMAHLARTDDHIKENGWGNFNLFTYVELRENSIASPPLLQKLNEQITQIYKAHHPQSNLIFRLQTLKDIHLHSHFFADLPGHGDIAYVQIFSVVALFILLVACINFMNLSTARSARRAKEVGLRKVVGASRQQLTYAIYGRVAAPDRYSPVGSPHSCARITTGIQPFNR